MTRISKTWTILVAAGLSGCSQLPLDGPAYRDIASGATASLTVSRDAVAYNYALVDLSSTVLDFLGDNGSDSIHKTFGTGRGSAPIIRVAAGDVVQVSIFESSSGGLFIPTDPGLRYEAGVRPGNYVTLPNQTVTRSGNISVPFAGTVHAEGQTPAEVQKEIEGKLASRAIEPQVIVTLVEQDAASVSVVGDTLNTANKFKIAGAGERILDVLSRAGGLKYAGYELYVTLQRHNKRATVHFPRLVNDPNENIFVMPGDTLYVYREPQRYVALGALGSASQTSGLNGQFNFDQERLSLNEALARAGGLQDSRANPAQVFLYRSERRQTLEKMGVNLSKFPTDQQAIPTIYRANFRDPSTFFFTQKFPMRNKDVIYVANSDSTEVGKFLGYIRGVTSTVAGVATDGAVTRDVINGAHVLN